MSNRNNSLGEYPLERELDTLIAGTLKAANEYLAGVMPDKERPVLAQTAENKTKGAVDIALYSELGKLLEKPITIGEKIDFIVENNKILGIENQVLKLWVAQLLSSDGFDGGCYDAQKLRLAREKLREILDNPSSI